MFMEQKSLLNLGTVNDHDPYNNIKYLCVILCINYYKIILNTYIGNK